MRRLLWLVVAGALVAGCSSAGAQERDGEDAARIRVVGSGVSRARPDLLTVSLGVQTRAGSASAALDENEQKATALREVLRQRGVADDDVQTSNVSVQQDYDNQGKVRGFVVDNSVTAKLRDLDKAGELLDAVADATGDAVRINGLSFSIEDPASAAGDARADAVRRARRQAEQLAEAADVSLGRLRSIKELSSQAPQPYAERYAMDTSAGSSVPLSPGTQEVRVEVELVYEVG